MVCRHRLSILAATAMVFGSGPASAAQSASTTIAVSVTVVPNCTVTAEPLAFGTATVAEASAAAVSASIEVACGPNTPFIVALDNGQNADGGSRRALDPATGQYLSYDIYADAAHAQRWGMAGSDTVSGTTASTGTAQLTAYGAIGAGQQPAAGSYADLVSVTTEF